MKAAVLIELNKPLELMDVPLPKLGVGHVLVNIDIAGVCGSQRLEIQGLKNNTKFLPHMMGHEGCGIVEDIGSGVTKVKIGDKVVMHWRVGSGIEADFVKYGKVGAGKVTTFSEQAVVSENRLTKIPHGVISEYGALLGCAITTAYGAVTHDANLQLGDSILIIGYGGVGHAISKACSLRGAGKIDVYDVKPGFKSWQQITQSKYDIIFDTVGIPSQFAKSIELLNSSGKYILVGQDNPANTLSIPNIGKFFDGNGKRLIASQGGNTNPDIDIPKYCNLYLHHKDYATWFISHKYPLEDVNTAIQQLSQPNTKRVILTI